MTFDQVILEYRQIVELEKERGGDQDGPETYQDDGYDQELKELGITPEMLKEMRGG
jgi:hypothetical protein